MCLAYVKLNGGVYTRNKFIRVGSEIFVIGEPTASILKKRV